MGHIANISLSVTSVTIHVSLSNSILTSLDVRQSRSPLADASVATARHRMIGSAARPARDTLLEAMLAAISKSRLASHLVILAVHDVTAHRHGSRSDPPDSRRHAALDGRMKPAMIAPVVGLEGNPPAR